EPLQSKLPGSSLSQSALQLALQSALQSTVGSLSQLARQSPAMRTSHCARTAIGSHIALHSAPGGTTSHSAFASSWMSPHAAMPCSARAGDACHPMQTAHNAD